MFVVGEVVAPINADTRPFQRGLNSAHSMGSTFITRIGSTFQSFGKSMANFGANLTKYVTVPLAGAAVAVFKFGKDFESELSKVVGLVGVSRDQVDAWGKDILELAPELGKAPRELADALFFVTSAGIRGAEAMEVLEMAGKASAAGLGETKTIADLVTSAMNAYGKENLSAAQATDIVTAAVREGKAEASELAATMGAVLPLASEMGVTFDQVAATQAAMTKTGTDAAEAATQLKGIMAGLIKPSKQAEDQLSAMGTSSSDLRKKIREEGLLSALMELKELTNKYGEEAMARVFPNIRALMGVLDLMGSNLDSNIETFDKVANSTGILDDAFEAASETVDFKWNQALAQIQSTAISFFDVMKASLIPILEKFVDVLGWIGNKFSSLTPGQQKIIAGFVAIAGIIGPVILGIGTLFLGLAGAIGGVITIVTTLGAVISAVGLPVLAAIAAIIPIIIGYIAGFIAIIGGLIAAFVNLYNTNDEFRTNVLNTWNVIKENGKVIFEEIKNTVIYVLGIIKRFWAKHGDEIKEIVKNIFYIILGIIRTVMYLIKDVIKLVSAIIKGDWSKAWEALKSIVKTVTISIIKGIQGMNVGAVKIFKSLGNVAVSLIQNMVSRIGSAIGALTKKGIEAGAKFISGLGKTDFVNAGVKIVAGIIRGIRKMFGDVTRVSRELAEHIRDFFPFSPAKIGPLKDLDKVDFAGPITMSLDKAAAIIDDSFLNNLSLDTAGIGGGITTNNNNSGFNFYGDMYFEGVRDMDDLLTKMKNVVQKQTGRRF